MVNISCTGCSSTPVQLNNDNALQLLHRALPVELNSNENAPQLCSMNIVYGNSVIERFKTHKESNFYFHHHQYHAHTYNHI